MAATNNKSFKNVFPFRILSQEHNFKIGLFATANFLYCGPKNNMQKKKNLSAHF